jgi:hypothetical protein
MNSDDISLNSMDHENIKYMTLEYLILKREEKLNSIKNLEK